MRISDWSSDVCSSDLPAAPANGQKNQILSECLLRFRPDPHRSRPPTRRTCFRDAQGRLAQWVERLVYTADDGRDRQRVVQGRSVAVRVDRGGRRIIEKKTICTTQ